MRTAVFRALPTPLRASVVVLAVAFLVPVSFHSHTTVNGVQTSCSYFDLGAVIGPIAGVLAVVTAVRVRDAGGAEARAVVALAALAVGVATLVTLRGFGLLLGPC
jgi:hypothetical protein